MALLKRDVSRSTLSTEVSRLVGSVVTTDVSEDMEASNTLMREQAAAFGGGGASPISLQISFAKKERKRERERESKRVRVIMRNRVEV